MKPTVYITRCPTYEQIEEKTAELLQMMGGIGRFVHPGDRVALKPNLLLVTSPKRAATTHPDLVAAAGKIAISAGGKPFLLDSPSGAYPHTRAALERVYRETGMAAAAWKAGLEVCLDTRVEEVSHPEGSLVKHFQLLSPLLEADLIINLPKFKTHAFMAATGGVKNLFGAIPGRAKPGYHATLTDQSLFARMLLDLADYLAPQLTIMDAVMGMEGNGPSNGDPRQLGLLLASEDPLALDLVMGEIMGLDGKNNPLLIEAEKIGRKPTKLEEIELVGMEIKDLRIPDFRLPDTYLADKRKQGASWWENTFYPLFRTGMTLKPRVIPETCIACGDCVTICPMDVIEIVQGDHPHAQIDDDDCIRCYCCHETCPEDAIELHKSLLYRVIRGS